MPPPANPHAALPDAATQPRASIPVRQRRRAKIVNMVVLGDKVTLTVKIFEPGPAPGSMVEVAEVTDIMSVRQFSVLPYLVNEVLDTQMERVLLSYHAQVSVSGILNHTRDF